MLLFLNHAAYKFLVRGILCMIFAAMLSIFGINPLQASITFMVACYFLDAISGAPFWTYEKLKTSNEQENTTEDKNE